MGPWEILRLILVLAETWDTEFDDWWSYFGLPETSQITNCSTCELKDTECSELKLYIHMVHMYVYDIQYIYIYIYITVS